MLDHPFVPGPTSAIEKGPWHYGADYISVYFRGEKPRLSELVPRPFEIEDGLCVAYVCEIVSVADGSEGMAASSPDRTLYHEAALGVKCSVGGRGGVFYPVMWVTSEASLLRGLLNGYQKRLADKISLTKLHPLNPGLKAVGPGTKLGGFCVKGSEKTLSVEMEIQRAGSPSDLPAFGATFGLRKFPRTGANQQSVDEPVEIIKSNSAVSDVWVGAGSATAVLDVGLTEPVLAAYYKAGFTISGSRPIVP